MYCIFGKQTDLVLQHTSELLISIAKLARHRVQETGQDGTAPAQENLATPSPRPVACCDARSYVLVLGTLEGTICCWCSAAAHTFRRAQENWRLSRLVGVPLRGVKGLSWIYRDLYG